MIIPMKKYSFLVYHRDYENFLHNLRELGVAHLIETQSDISDNIREKYQQIEKVEKSLRFLKKREIENGNKLTDQDGKMVFQHLTEIQNQLESQQHALAGIQKEINEILPWGDFSMDILTKLKENGIKLRFFVTQTRKYDPAWEEEYPIQVINSDEGNIYFVLVGRCISS